jgi:hypothetical protein
VGSQHQSDGAALRAATSIASMHDGRPFDSAPEAIVTNISIAIKIGGRAKQSIVVEAHDHGCARVFYRIDGRRRDERKCVMKMHNIRFEFPNALLHLSVNIAIPHRIRRDRDFGSACKTVIMECIASNVVATVGKQSTFSLKNGIPPSSLLVIIMYDQTPHLLLPKL